MNNEIIKRIKNFTKERNWDQFHTPENLSKAISIESSELLEQFIWSSDYKDINKVAEELADIFIYSILLSEKLELNIEQIINDKIDKNYKKYPISKAYNNSKKYNEF